MNQSKYAETFAFLDLIFTFNGSHTLYGDSSYNSKFKLPTNLNLKLKALPKKKTRHQRLNTAFLEKEYA